eukprot:2851697-Prymnesium_polylepis.1
MDDLRGEVLLLQWDDDVKALGDNDKGAPPDGLAACIRSSVHGYNVIEYDVSKEASHFRTAQREVPTFATKALHVYSFVEGRGPRIPFFKRLIRLDGNQLVMPLRVRQVDPIGEDIHNIPAVFQALQADWDAPAGSLN